MSLRGACWNVEDVVEVAQMIKFCRVVVGGGPTAVDNELVGDFASPEELDRALERARGGTCQVV